MTVYIDLGQPLVSKVRIDGRIQCVEYESLPSICFGCGRVGHARDSYPFEGSYESVDSREEGLIPDKVEKEQRKSKEDKFGLWMLVERKHRKNTRPAGRSRGGGGDRKLGGSRFDVLSENPGILEDGIAVDVNGSNHHQDNGEKIGERIDMDKEKNYGLGRSVGNKKGGNKNKGEGIVIGNG